MTDGYSDLEELFLAQGWKAPPGGLLLRVGSFLGLDECRIVAVADGGGAVEAAASPVLRETRGRAEALIPVDGPDGPVVLSLTLSGKPGQAEELLLSALSWALKAESALAAESARAADLQAENRERAGERERWLNFFYVTVHDLKEPVSAVLNYLKTVLRKGTAGMDQRLVQMIRRSIIRLDGMLDMISGLLELARLESGSAEEPFGPVDMEELLGSCTELAHELAMPREVRVGLSVKRPLPRIKGSELRLNQMLMNLLTNAVKYTPPGGRVTLRASRVGDELELQVEDDGIGIPPEHQQRVFEEFYRVDPTEEGGTGLGLSIARRIAEMHGGSIRLESPVTAQGSGTRVTVRLPLAPESAP